MFNFNLLQITFGKTQKKQTNKYSLCCERDMNLSKICKTHLNLCIQTPTLCTVSKNDAFLHLEMMPFCIWIGTARWVVVFSVELLELRRTKGRPDFFLTPPPVRLWSFCDKSACAKKSRDFLALANFEQNDHKRTGGGVKKKSGRPFGAPVFALRVLH